jgi:predicted DNA-binding transcriptional regulator AlpA
MTMKLHDQNVAREDGRRRGNGAGSRPDTSWLKVTVKSEPPTGPNGDPSLGSAARPAAPVTTVPTTLSTLRQTPGRAAEVPVDQIPALVVELAAEQAALSAIQGALTVRLLVAPAEHRADDGGDRLLTASEVAGVLGVTKRWVQRRARRLPFARRISVRSVRYSEAGLKRWMAHRHVPKP